MRTLTYLFLLIPSLSFAQSKKELRTEIQNLQSKTDSITIETEKRIREIDSLKTVLKSKDQKISSLNQQVSQLEISNKAYQTSAKESSEEISRLEEELDNCMTKGKSSTPSKTKTSQNNTSTKLPANYANNPFGTGGGSGAGNGGSIGNDDGNGLGAYSNRILVKRPSVESISSDEDCKITFTIVINEDGEIVGFPAFVRSGTTTTNEVLIKQVASIIKSQAKYNAVKGAANVKQELVIRIETK